MPIQSADSNTEHPEATASTSPKPNHSQLVGNRKTSKRFILPIVGLVAIVGAAVLYVSQAATVATNRVPAIFARSAYQLPAKSGGYHSLGLTITPEQVTGTDGYRMAEELRVVRTDAGKSVTTLASVGLNTMGLNAASPVRSIDFKLDGGVSAAPASGVTLRTTGGTSGNTYTLTKPFTWKPGIPYQVKMTLTDRAPYVVAATVTPLGGTAISLGSITLNTAAASFGTNIQATHARLSGSLDCAKMNISQATFTSANVENTTPALQPQVFTENVEFLNTLPPCQAQRTTKKLTGGMDSLIGTSTAAALSRQSTKQMFAQNLRHLLGVTEAKATGAVAQAGDLVASTYLGDSIGVPTVGISPDLYKPYVDPSGANYTYTSGVMCIDTSAHRLFAAGTAFSKKWGDPWNPDNGNIVAQFNISADNTFPLDIFSRKPDHILGAPKVGDRPFVVWNDYRTGGTSSTTVKPGIYPITSLACDSTTHRLFVGEAYIGYRISVFNTNGLTDGKAPEAIIGQPNAQTMTNTSLPLSSTHFPAITKLTYSDQLKSLYFLTASAVEHGAPIAGINTANGFTTNMPASYLLGQAAFGNVEPSKSNVGLAIDSSSKRLFALRDLYDGANAVIDVYDISNPGVGMQPIFTINSDLSLPIGRYDHLLYDSKYQRLMILNSGVTRTVSQVRQLTTIDARPGVLNASAPVQAQYSLAGIPNTGSESLSFVSFDSAKQLLIALSGKDQIKLAKYEVPAPFLQKADVRSRIVNIALAETGQTEFSARVLQFTDGNRESWCADFVSWVYRQAGVPFMGGLSGGWRIPSVLVGPTTLKSYFIKYGTYTPIGKDATGKQVAPTAKPSPGDVVMFGDGGNSHTGIVAALSGDGFDTVEGNTGGPNPDAPADSEAGDHVARKHYAWSDPKVTGFGNVYVP